MVAFKGNEEGKGKENPKKKEKKQPGPMSLTAIIANLVEKVIVGGLFLSSSRKEEELKSPDYPTLEETCQVFSSIIQDLQEEVRINPRKYSSLWTVYSLFTLRLLECHAKNIIDSYMLFIELDKLSPDEVEEEGDRISTMVKEALEKIVQERKKK